MPKSTEVHTHPDPGPTQPRNLLPSGRTALPLLAAAEGIPQHPPTKLLYTALGQGIEELTGFLDLIKIDFVVLRQIG